MLMPMIIPNDAVLSVLTIKNWFWVNDIIVELVVIIKTPHKKPKAASMK